MLLHYVLLPRSPEAMQAPLELDVSFGEPFYRLGAPVPALLHFTNRSAEPVLLNFGCIIGGECDFRFDIITPSGHLPKPSSPGPYQTFVARPTRTGPGDTPSVGIIEILPGDTRTLEVKVTRYVIFEEEGVHTVEAGYVNRYSGPWAPWVGILRSPSRSFTMVK